MDPAVRRALETDFTVDITTTGRRSGEPRRIEIWMLHIDGRFFITGTPHPRDWLANLRADPRLTVHLKQGVIADVAARAVEVVDRDTRRWVFEEPLADWYLTQTSIEHLIDEAPMVELHFEE